tara:strand:- start:24 stop:212 length:189 start_codon:yes stop_codon:yes gene_type:complete
VLTENRQGSQEARQQERGELPGRAEQRQGKAEAEEQVKYKILLTNLNFSQLTIIVGKCAILN